MTFLLQLIVNTTGKIVSLTHLFCNYITSFKKANAQFQFLSSLSVYKTNSNMEFNAVLCRTSMDLTHLIFSSYIQILLTDQTGQSALAQIVIPIGNLLPSSLAILFLSILWKQFNSNFIIMKSQPTIPNLIYSFIQQII